MDKNQDYRDYYQSKESATEYDEVAYKEGTYGSIIWKLEKEILEAFLISLRKKSDKIRYLDFACGTGRIISAVEKFVDESFGIDINQSMLDRAADKLKNTTLIQGDITKNDKIIEYKFDLISTFRFVLNANPELRESALKILSNNLNSDKSWLVFNMHTNKYSYAYMSYLWYSIFGQSPDNDIRRYMTRNECIRIANNAGLKVVKIRGLGFLSGKLYSMLPSSLALGLERTLLKIPIFNQLGTDLIFFCQKKGI